MLICLWGTIPEFTYEKGTLDIHEIPKVPAILFSFLPINIPKSIDYDWADTDYELYDMANRATECMIKMNNKK